MDPSERKLDLKEVSKKMKVITKSVTAGTPVVFRFDAAGSRFLIKNFTKSPISCKILDATICIPANTSQMVATRQPPQSLEDYHRDGQRGIRAGGGNSVHGLLIEPEISGQMAYIGLAVGVYGQGDIEYRHSTGTAVFIGVLCDSTNVITIKPKE